MPKDARIGKGFFTALNNAQNQDLENILKIAYSHAQTEKRVTIFAKDIRWAIETHKRIGAVFILNDIQTVLGGKIEEMKINLRGEN